jgi:flagellar basal-body rod modification protein FlgD
MSFSSIGDFASQTQNAAAAASASSSTVTAGSTGSTGQLDQNEFLKLMVAQLKNQNPTQPTDPTQFVTQLAQFSQVTGIENMQSSLAGLVGQMRTSQLMNGTSLVGHKVLAPATTATIAAGGQVSGAADVPAGATAMQVQVQDAYGQTVRVFPVSPQQGTTNFTWDGTTNSGAAAPAGTYSFKVVAAVDGSATSLDPMLQTTVNSVTIDPTTQDLTLNTNSGALDLSSVRQVM